MCKLLYEIRWGWNRGRNETAMIREGLREGKTILRFKFWLGKSYWNHKISKVGKDLQDQAQTLTKCMIPWIMFSEGLSKVRVIMHPNTSKCRCDRLLKVACCWNQRCLPWASKIRPTLTWWLQYEFRIRNLALGAPVSAALTVKFYKWLPWGSVLL